MTKKYSTLFIALLFAIANVEGQTSWTLQQCLQRALDYNITIKQSALGNEIDKITVDQNTFAWAKSLNLYHHATCPVVKRIKRENLIFGSALRPGRIENRCPHDN